MVRVKQTPTLHKIIPSLKIFIIFETKQNFFFYKHIYNPKHKHNHKYNYKHTSQQYEPYQWYEYRV